MRVVHYLNQFFGGLGGEERAGASLEAREGAVGPGKLLEPLLGSDAQVVLTLVCGDNYAVENQDAFIGAALRLPCGRESQRSRKIDVEELFDNTTRGLER